MNVYLYANESLIIPKAPMQESSLTFRYEKRKDPFFWMKSTNDSMLMQYIEEENRYALAGMDGCISLQDKLYEEFKKNKSEEQIKVRYLEGDYIYYEKKISKESYPFFCRLKKGEKEEVLLNINDLAEDKENYEVGNLKVSPKGDFLCYTFDRNGSKQYSLGIKELKSEKKWEIAGIQNISDQVAWTDDGKALFYIQKDELGRPFQLKRHVLRTPIESDVLLFEEKDSRYVINLTQSASMRSLFVTSMGLTSTEVYILDPKTKADSLALIFPRKEGVSYKVETFDNLSLYILTNDGAKNFRVVSIPFGSRDFSTAQEIVPGRDNVFLENMLVFDHALVLLERQSGLPQLEFVNLIEKKSHRLTFSEPGYSLISFPHFSVREPNFHFVFSSFLIPPTQYCYHLLNEQIAIENIQRIGGDIDPRDYVAERIFAKSLDGTMIPISLFYKKTLSRFKAHPLLLFGYGAYGVSYDPFFSYKLFSLAKRGVIIAIAHVRGGGENGVVWHEQGTLLNKKNTFTDFIDCAKHLIKSKYTSSECLVISGRSAGGLLIGNVINLKPKLFKAAVAEVPFVDSLNVMLDERVPWTAFELSEWGDPYKAGYYEYLKSYSPYENVRKQQYPSLLITGGLYDPYVSFCEPAKWAAKLRLKKTDTNPLYLKIDLHKGHEDHANLDIRLNEAAYKYAFILNQMEISK